MKYYDQIDVMPTYFAQILIWNVLCGLVLLDEYRFYSTWKLVTICICSIVSFIGIQILAKKSSQESGRSEKSVKPDETQKIET